MTKKYSHLKTFILQNENWEELLTSPPYNLTIRRDGKYILFKYSMIDSDLSLPEVQDARGIIFRENNWDIVCYPFQKAFNIQETLAAPIDWNTAKVTEKVDGCFTADDSVMLANGKKMKIGHIVNHRLDVDVLSYNFDTGEIEPKKVTGWKKSRYPLPKDEWLTISLRGVRQSLFGKISQHCVITPTRNHGVFRKKDNFIEEVLAKDLKVGDIIFTPVETLTPIEEQVVLGTLLGDGSCTYSYDRYNYQGIKFTHSKKQSEYVRYKARFLKRIGGKYSEKIVSDSYSNEKSIFKSRVNSGIHICHKLCYENGKKKVSRDWIEKLSWIGFSIWYMDDGSLDAGSKNNSIHLHTEGFTREEVEIIHDFYNEKGYKNYIQTYRGYSIINFSTSSSEKIWKNIRRYIHPSMSYKLPERHRGYYSELVDNSSPEIVLNEGEIKEIKRGLHAHDPYKSKGKYRYDIEVEDNHNYFCQGLLVHNSLIKVWNDGGIWNISTNGTIFAINAEVVNSNPIGRTFYDLFMCAAIEQRLDFRKLNPNYTYLFELCSPYTKVVVHHPETVIYHIGTRENATGDYVEHDIEIRRPEIYDINSPEESLSMVENLPFDDEGYVVKDVHGNMVKIKSPAYVAAHRMVNNGVITPARMLDIILLGEMSEFLSCFPEYTESFEEVLKSLTDIEAEADYIIRKLPKKMKDFQSRKDLATWAKGTDIPSFVFSYVDGHVENFEEWFSKLTENRKLKILGY